jgi:PAS domain S-box-containing protein
LGRLWGNSLQTRPYAYSHEFVRNLKTTLSRDLRSPSIPEDLDFRAVFDAAADGMFLVGTDGRIREANRELERQFGYGPGELQGEPVESLVPPRLRGDHGWLRKSYQELPNARPMGVGLELRGLRKDGTEFPIEISLSPHGADGELLTICMVRDMTERNQLRNLGIAAIQGAERERRRIAQELHDDTAQLLSALMLRLKLLIEEDDADRRSEMGQSFRDDLRGAAEGVRRIARGLRPPALEDAGVVTALRGHASSFFEGTDLTWDLHADAVDHLLEEGQKLVLYRVVQEAMSNVVRHAQASSIEVLVRLDGNRVVASVRDDGVGFDVERVIASGEGLGLLGMRERALGVGGQIECRSKIGEGTKILLTLRVEAEETTNG